MLFDGSWADVEVSGDFLIAASLRQQPENFLIAGRDLDGVQIDHEWLLIGYERPFQKHEFRQTFAHAVRWDKDQ